MLKYNTLAAWVPTIVVEVGDHFHRDFQIGFQAKPCKYIGVNMGYTTWVQQYTRL
jgi:hypothetical protein